MPYLLQISRNIKNDNKISLLKVRKTITGTLFRKYNNVEDNINKSLDKSQLEKLQNPHISIIHPFFHTYLPRLCFK